MNLKIPAITHERRHGAQATPRLIAARRRRANPGNNQFCG